jgi:hypothetical protein
MDVGSTVTVSSGNVAPLSGFRSDEGLTSDLQLGDLLLIPTTTNTETIMHRLLQENNRGRTVLTVLYLVVLGMCFVVPVFYYVRMHCEERYARRLRELELAGITQALEQSQNIHREESRAARRKFREERRARIIQLFTPVKMVRSVV